MNMEGALNLITALAENAAEEYRDYMTTLQNITLNREEKKYFKLRAEETLNFFDSPIFTLAFPDKSEYIKEQLRKEFKK